MTRPTPIGAAAIAEFLSDRSDSAAKSGAIAAAVVFVTADGAAVYGWRLPSVRNNGAAYLALAGAANILSARLAECESVEPDEP